MSHVIGRIIPLSNYPSAPTNWSKAFVGKPPEITPMPATRQQAADIRRGLRSIIRWAKSPGSKAGKVDREKVLLDALEAALRELDAAPNSLAAWIIGAMFASLRKGTTADGGPMWFVTDRRLFDEACDALEFLHQRQATTGADSAPSK